MIPKFRAWHHELGRMMLIRTMFFFANELEELQLNDSIMNDDIPVYPDEIELMQSTGLKDKNGKEIFEGDIVQFEDYYIESDLSYINEGIVEWSQGGFNITNRSSVVMEDLLDGEFLDVTNIGNIYENPELLEEK